MTLGIASGPGSFSAGSTTLTTVHNGVATFSNLTLVKPGKYQLSAIVPYHYTGPYSATFTVAPLQVVPGSFTSTPSGFSLQFNAPFLVNSVTPVLYGQGFGPTAPVPSVTLTHTRDGSGNSIVPVLVEGSLVLNTATNTITFVETNTASLVSNSTPILPDGTYVVDVTSSGTSGFQALNSGGGFLDGLEDGTPGSGDFTATFTINAAAAGDDVLWVPDVAEGPGQPLNAPGMNQAGGGYPVYLNDSSGAVSNVQLALNYDPALLTVTSVTGPGFSLLATSTPGQAVLQYSGPVLPAGSQTPIGYIIAQVPSGTAANPTPYKAKDLLHLSNVSINGGTIPVATADALHLVAYVGDANGIGTYYNANDSVLITRVSLQADSGFTAYPLVDPVIVADTDGSGFIPADAALQINEAGVGFPTANLASPPIPPEVYFQGIANNVDPSISIPNDLEVGADGMVAVPLNIDDADPADSTGLIRAKLALTYDPHQFSVSAADIHLGSVLAAGSGWTIVPTINAVTGEMAMALSSTIPISSTIGGSLVTIDFHEIGASLGATAIALVASANPTGQQVLFTELEDAQGTFTLTPAPTNGFDPQIDAMVVLNANPGVAVGTPTLITPVEVRDQVSSVVDIVGSMNAVVSTSEETVTPTSPIVISESSEPSLIAGPSALADTTQQVASVATRHGASTVVGANSTVVFTGVSRLAAPAGDLMNQFGIPSFITAGTGVGVGQQPLDQVFQTLGGGTTDPKLFATVKDVFERIMAGQLMFSPFVEDNLDSQWDELTSDFDLQGIALAGHRARRDVTADLIAPPLMIQHAGPYQDALDRYFAHLVAVADQGNGDG